MTDWNCQGAGQSAFPLASSALVTLAPEQGPFPQLPFPLETSHFLPSASIRNTADSRKLHPPTSSHLLLANCDRCKGQDSEHRSMK